MHFFIYFWKNIKQKQIKGGLKMQISNTELDNIRHLMLEVQATAEKTNFFAQQVSNPQLKSHLNRKAQQCQQNVQRLSQFISQ